MFRQCYSPPVRRLGPTPPTALGMLAPVSTTDAYPGQAIGLPESGRGALASWGSRLGALVLDWGASMAVAVGAFGGGVLTESGWRAWTVLAVYFVQKAVLTAFTGSSFGQLVSGIGVTRLGGGPIGLVRAVARAAMVCLVVPAVVVGPERRGLHDLALGTVVVRRR